MPSEGPLSNLLMLAGPAATIVAAGAAVFVTWKIGKGQLTIADQQRGIAEQQANLAAVRLKHDLFDRRFEVYEITRSFLLEIFQRGDLSAEGLGTFVLGTGKAVFVFDQSVTDYLAELREKAILLQELNSILRAQDAVDPTELTAAPRRKADLMKWFVAQFDVLVVKFKPFLELDGNTAVRAPSPTNRTVAYAS